MDIIGGLMAGANFGQGFFEGKDAAVGSKMKRLAYQEAQLRAQQNQQAYERQQMLADKAMELFNPTGTTSSGQVPEQVSNPSAGEIAGIGTGQGLAGTPQKVGRMETPPQQAPQNTIEKMDALANFAAAQGDIGNASKLFTLANNLAVQDLNKKMKDISIDTGEYKRRQAHYKYASDLALRLPHNESGFNQWKMQMLSDPMASPEERQNVANMQYRDGIMDTIANAGMTASQQAAMKLRELNTHSIIERRNFLNNKDRRTLAERRRHNIAMENRRTTQRKVGAKPVTIKEQAITAPIVQSYIAEQTQGSGEIPTEKLQNITVQVAGMAKQIAKNNTAVTYEQAVNIALQKLKENGLLDIETPEDTRHTLMGIPLGSAPTPTVELSNEGNTAQDPIPFTGQKRGELIQGRFYKNAKGVVAQWTGDGFQPVQ